jgi:ferrous iron transport protein A
MDLTLAEVGKEYIIKEVETGDSEVNSFLFSLGCYSGEPITVINKMKSACIVIIKNARYSIDKNLAKQVKI